jgi:hypothetical protein
MNVLIEKVIPMLIPLIPNAHKSLNQLFNTHLVNTPLAQTALAAQGCAHSHHDARVAATQSRAS